LRKNDPAEWLEEHGDYLFRLAVLRLRNTEAAEDAVRETLLTAVLDQSANRQGSVRTWLSGILKLKIRDGCFKLGGAPIPDQTREKEDEDAFFQGADGEWPNHWRIDHAPVDWHLDGQATIEHEDFWEALERVLAELPAQSAKAFTLRELDGLSAQEVCTVMKLTPHDLNLILHRARLKLRHSLESRWFRNELRKPGKAREVPAQAGTDDPLSGFRRTLKLAAWTGKTDVRIRKPFRPIAG